MSIVAVPGEEYPPISNQACKGINKMKVKAETPRF